MSRIMQAATLEAFPDANGHSFIALLRLWQSRWRERRCLASLDSQMLDDIGLSREQAWNEAERPFWDGCDRPGQAD